MPDTALSRLVYHSRNLIEATDAELLVEVRQILATSRRNNERVGVTGALMFNRGCFAQVLEGPRDAVETTFERIQLDPRHAQVMLMDISAIQARGFPNWSMAFVGQASTSDPKLAAIQADSGFDPRHLSGDGLFALLRELVIDEDRSAA